MKNKLRSLFWKLGRQIRCQSNDHSIISVCEYPKAGGTWIAKTIASAVDLPYVGGGYFIPIIPSVLRTHWKLDARLAPCIVVVRDPRDVMVSLFHHRARNIDRTPARKAQYKSLVGGTIDAGQIRSQLARFIEIEFDDPRYGASINWQQYANNAIELCLESQHKKIALVRYEEMLEFPTRTLAETLDKLEINVPEPYQALAIQLHDKKWGNKQYIKNKNETTFLRSASSGDWRSSFNRNSAEVLANYCNGELIRLGYEADDSWWKKIPE